MTSRATTRTRSRSSHTAAPSPPSRPTWNWADPVDAQGPGTGRPRAEGHRPRGAERGVRLAGARLDARAGLGPRPPQRERRRDRARSPARRLRGAPDRHARPRAAPARRPLRSGHDVHRRRPGHGGGHRGGLAMDRAADAFEDVRFELLELEPIDETAASRSNASADGSATPASRWMAHGA